MHYMLLYEYHYGMLEAACSVAGIIVAYRLFRRARAYFRRLRTKNFVPPLEDRG